jgi:hypothetical protein
MGRNELNKAVFDKGKPGKKKQPKKSKKGVDRHPEVA